MNKHLWRWPGRLKSRHVRVSLARSTMTPSISQRASVTISEVPSIFLTFFTWVVENDIKTKNYGTKEKFPLFFPLPLPHHLMNWGIYPAAINAGHPLGPWHMLLANRFSCYYFSAPEFWKQEKLHVKSGGSQSSPGDAFPEPGPISGHDNCAHQRGRRGRAPCIWTWLLLCGGTWRCGNRNNHTDHFCQGPRCDQQFDQVFPQISPFFLYPGIFPSLVSNFLAFFPLASFISGDSPISLNSFCLNTMDFSWYLEMKYHCAYNSPSMGSATHTRLTSQSCPYCHFQMDNSLLWGSSCALHPGP